MSDLIELSFQCLPWKPPGSEPAVVLNYYDMPLVGIVRQTGLPYLFRCIEGQLDDINRWLFVGLDEAQVNELSTAAGGELSLLVDRISAQQPGIVAVADDHGILAWVEAGADVERRLMAEINEQVERLERSVTALAAH